MGRFFDASKEGFNEGRQKSKAGANERRDEDNPKVIVFEITGEVKIATLCGDSVCRENLTAYEECPQELLNLVPPGIVDFCKKTAPHYLYLTKDENGDTIWQSTIDPVEI